MSKADSPALEIRNRKTEFQTRETDGKKCIEAVFASFNDIYDMGWCTESIDPHAFDETLDRDIRALIDHESRLVLGRNTAGTLQLRIEDGVGLIGTIEINEDDQDAMNLYARVLRGDVNQCSFGFEILDEERTLVDGKDHWTIKRLKLREVSIVTFPAYEKTTATARSADRRQRSFIEWKNETERKIKSWHSMH